MVSMSGIDLGLFAQMLLSSTNFTGSERPASIADHPSTEAGKRATRQAAATMARATRHSVDEVSFRPAARLVLEQGSRAQQGKEPSRHFEI